jgi:hypothetical protein
LKGDPGAGISLAKVYTVDGTQAGPDAVGMAYSEALCQPGDVVLTGGCKFTGNAAGNNSNVKVYNFGAFKNAAGTWGYSCTGTNVSATYVIADAVCLDL